MVKDRFTAKHNRVLRITVPVVFSVSCNNKNLTIEQFRSLVERSLNNLEVHRSLQPFFDGLKALDVEDFNQWDIQADTDMIDDIEIGD